MKGVLEAIITAKFFRHGLEQTANSELSVDGALLVYLMVGLALAGMGVWNWRNALLEPQEGTPAQRMIGASFGAIALMLLGIGLVGLSLNAIILA